MTWSISADVEEFAAAAGPFLRARPAQNTVALTVVESLRAGGPRAYGSDAPMFGWWQPPGGEVAASFLQTPPFPLLLSSGSAEAMRELAKTLVNAGRALPGVNGDMTAAEQFVAQWQQYTGAVAAVHQHTRLYRLGDLVPPRPAPPGHPRIAGRADRDQLTAWFTAFMTEAGALVERDSEQEVDDRIGYGGLTLWETGGAAVSMAGRTRRVAGMIRVGPVYTPPELRRRGYGGAATAAVTQAALDEGVAEVLLFTDLANPTSNALYQHLGYQAVEDRVLLTFSS